MAKFIRSSGEVEGVVPANGAYFTLEELQRFVGGYIEISRTIIPGVLIVMNEEGKLNGLPRNVTATSMFMEAAGLCGDPAKVPHLSVAVVGDVLVGTMAELDGPPDNE